MVGTPKYLNKIILINKIRQSKDKKYFEASKQNIF